MQVGKTYFELVNYLEAGHFFELAHRLSPCTLEGMDIYSTVLYVSGLTALVLESTLFPPFASNFTSFVSLLQHLNEEMRLSYLAQDLVSIDRLSPQAWFVFLCPASDFGPNAKMELCKCALLKVINRC